MAIETTTQILYDGVRNAVVQITGRSDGSGQETDVVKIDVSELQPPAARVAIKNLTYDVAGGTVTLSWKADANVPFAQLQGNDKICYEAIRGQQNAAWGELGANGDILLSTRGFELDSIYTIKFDLIKKYA
jgi:hypothetical protein